MPNQQTNKFSSITALNEIIELSLVWFYDTKLRAFRASMPDGLISIPVTKKLMVLIHPRLPAVLRRLTEDEAGSATAVRKTIAMWATERPLLVNMGRLRYLARVNEYYGLTNDGLAHVSGALWDIYKLNDGTLFTSGKFGVFEVRIDPALLEASYSGCIQQLELLTAMGLQTPQEVADAVFRVVPGAEAAVLPALDYHP
jgi:hypothetical protein